MSHKTLGQYRPARAMSFAALLVAHFLYVQLHVRPDFLFNSIEVFGSSFPNFSTSRRFLVDALSYPGGVAGYLSALLSQAYVSAWLGALVTTVLAAAVTVTLEHLARRQSGSSAGLLALGPALLGLIVVQRYLLAVPMLVNLTLVTACSLVFLSLLQWPSRWRIAAIPLLFAAVYYVTGWGGCLFSLVTTMAAVKSRTLVPLVCGLGVLFTAYPVLQSTLLVEDPSLQYGSLFHVDNRGMVVHWYDLAGAGYVVALLASARACAAFLDTCFRRAPRAALWRRTAGWVVGLSTVVACLTVTYDQHRRDFVESEYLVRRGAWDAIRAKTDMRQIDQLTAVNLFDLNLALFHQGVLSEEMFRYPQNPRALALPTPTRVDLFPVTLRDALLSFELGKINLAKMMLYELYEQSVTEHPYLLNALAECHLVTGQPAAARRWYTHLTHDLVYGRRATTMLKRLDEGAQYGADQRLAEVADRAIDRDTAVSARYLRQISELLLDKDKDNRMAWEYRVNTCLLNGDLRSFYEYLSNPPEFGARALPRHWQEALLLCREVDGTADAQLPELVGSGLQTRFDQFMEAYARIAQECTGPAQANQLASRLLRKEFGGTYFFYYVFHESGDERWYR